MTEVSRRLLQRLDVPVRPTAASGSAPPRAPFERMDFGSLLHLAVQPGALGRPVGLAEGVTLSPALDEDALARLGGGADLAYGEGSRSAALVMSGRVFRVDVGARQILGELGFSDGRPDLSTVDSVVLVPDRSSPAPVGPPRGLAPFGFGSHDDFSPRVEPAASPTE